ncbi:MAG: hypothetical protein KJZ69_00960 [Phycisphaerales bacterium]|nr:hypothetical protein [Phycisphaerales bacterium]
MHRLDRIDCYAEVLKEVAGPVKETNFARVEVVDHSHDQIAHALDVRPLIDDGGEQKKPEDRFTARNAAVAPVQLGNKQILRTGIEVGPKGVNE